MTTMMTVSRIFFVFAAFAFLSAAAEQNNDDKRVRRLRVIDLVDSDIQRASLNNRIDESFLLGNDHDLSRLLGAGSSLPSHPEKHVNKKKQYSEKEVHHESGKGKGGSKSKKGKGGSKSKGKGGSKSKGKGGSKSSKSKGKGGSKSYSKSGKGKGGSKSYANSGKGEGKVDKSGEEVDKGGYVSK